LLELGVVTTDASQFPLKYRQEGGLLCVPALGAGHRDRIFSPNETCVPFPRQGAYNGATPRRENPMPAKKYTKSVHVGLTPELFATIRLAALNRKTTASELIRSAIERELRLWPLRPNWTAAEVMKVFREEDR
jgi:hypothetical protein